MILSGEQIRSRMGDDINIEPFDDAKINPNSYDLSLHNELLIYEEVVLDVRQPNRYRRIAIPDQGIVMQPGCLYLGRTRERTETHGLVPMLEGRSSLGRLGLHVRATAGFGDAGFCGFWTLEMHAIQPIRIYPNIDVCQIMFHEICGDIEEYASKYQNSNDIQPSLMYKEFDGAADNDQQLELDFESLVRDAVS